MFTLQRGSQNRSDLETRNYRIATGSHYGNGRHCALDKQCQCTEVKLLGAICIHSIQNNAPGGLEVRKVGAIERNICPYLKYGHEPHGH
eukprot:scaffold328385_cov16-Prasinocladus_malaysianus.AAC.1